MRLHRFYIDSKEIELKHQFWLNNKELRNQWLRVLRYKQGDQVILFDGIETERLYSIAQIEEDAIKLEMITEFARKLPSKHIYLFFSLLKKDKNEWVLQKCTELGVRNFIPIIADRSEKLGFNIDRARKIIIEASEQCGRSDIPDIREPVNINTAIETYKNNVSLYVCEQEFQDNKNFISNNEPIGVLIGPEGGWTKEELSYFDSNNLGKLNLGSMTLRAETACIVASTKLLHS